MKTTTEESIREGTETSLRSAAKGGYTDHGDQPPSMARAIISAPTTASTMPALLLAAVPSASCSSPGGSSKE